MHKVLKEIVGSSRGGFNRVIVRIHHAVIVQMDLIRATMNQALTTRQMVFDDPTFPPGIRMLFSRLFYRVSDRCFLLLLEMYQQILKEEYSNVCDDHWVRDCLGMPCVHDLARAIISKTPLVPDDFHDFWKELRWEDDAINLSLPDDNRSMSIPEIRMREMWAKWESGDLRDGTLFRLSELYIDLEHPEQSSLVEPTNLFRKGKGRPPGSKNKEKQRNGNSPPREKREKSYHEYVREDLTNTENAQKVAKEKANRQSERPTCPKKQASQVSFDFGSQSQPEPLFSETIDLEDEDMNVVPLRACYPDRNETEEGEDEEEIEEAISYMGVNLGVKNIDYFWLSYMTSVKDVRSDGHCGYRSMALLTGMQQSQYRMIRAALAAELLGNKETWEPIRRGLRVGTWDDLIAQVNYMRSPCERPFWMDMPFMGLVFATVYNVGLVQLSWDAPCLCLPIRQSTVSPGPPQKIFGIALVGCSNHWIPVRICGNLNKRHETSKSFILID